MKKLNQETWIEAGFQTLDRYGYQQLSIEKTARRLNVTRGSFYHHFDSRSSFVDALLNRWKAQYTDSVINYADAGANAHARLERYLEVASRMQPGREVAIRAWAAKERRVSEVLQEVDASRSRFAYELGRELLLHRGEGEIQRFARLACLAFIGFQQTGPHGSQNFIELVRDILALAGASTCESGRGAPEKGVT